LDGEHGVELVVVDAGHDAAFVRGLAEHEVIALALAVVTIRNTVVAENSAP
jgi:hypothetical protein